MPAILPAGDIQRLAQDIRANDWLDQGGVGVKEAICTLARLPVGRKGTVLDIQTTGNARRRLLDLGLVPGTVVEVVRRSPIGDPTAYKIRGAVIALREEDGDAVRVRPV